MRHRVQPIGIRDALSVVFLAAICFAICKARVEGTGLWLSWIGIFLPAIVAGALQRRFQTSTPTACAILYPLTIAWGFVGGVVYSLHWIRTPHDFFERNSLGVEQPLHYGLFAAKIWLIAGLLYVLAYAVLAWAISAVVAKWSMKRDSK